MKFPWPTFLAGIAAGIVLLIVQRVLIKSSIQDGKVTQKFAFEE